MISQEKQAGRAGSEVSIPPAALKLPPSPGALEDPLVGVSFSVSFPCQLAAVRSGVAQIRKFLEERSLPEDFLGGSELALVEASNNAVLYAKDKNPKPVEIQVSCSDSRLEFQVVDHTPGFDWPEELALPENDNEHGRGLFIMNSVMDELSYLRGRGENRLIMRKSRLSNTGRNPAASDAQLGKMEEKLALSEQVIGAMARELCNQIVSSRQQEEEIDNRLMAHELEIARNIQDSLLPKTFPVMPGFGLSGFCRSARQVGGDFYDVVPLSDHSVLLIVADVMGKGVPASLFAATLRTLVRSMAEWTQQPAELLLRMNRLLFHELSGVDMFITAQLAVADFQKQMLSVGSAGHCPLFVVHGDGSTKKVAPEGMPLGILAAAEYAEEHVSLQNVECALLYTDGLTDARNPHGEFFGQDRLESWWRQNAGHHRSAAEIAENFLADLRRFQSNVPPSDDQTLLVLSRESASALNGGTQKATHPLPALQPA
jgi:serine phosphatase RsbU (regulator of sigma subunit)/anti-sigma regulatory factor (Ser/Thr protein kinase)